MRLPLSVLLAVLMSVAPVAAKHWHENEKHGKKHSDRAATCYVQPRDVRIIREYYEPRRRSLPPGLAKKFYRTGHLPPGWERKMEPLPVAVERQLVVLPPEYRRGFIDGSIVVYSPRTQMMIDVVAVFER
jgi:hypothetical protein